MLLIKIFLVFTLVAVLPSVFIYSRLNIKNARKLLKRYFWLPPLFITLGLVYLTFIASGKLLNDNDVIMGWLVMLYFGLVIPRFILSIILLISLPFHYFYKGLTRPLLIVAAILSFIVEGGLIYGIFIGRNQFEVKQFVYESPHIPQAFDNYKIAQISDLHMGGWIGNKAALKRFVSLVNHQNTDVIVFTGDLVNQRAVELKGFDVILSELNSPDGVYSILGNHDYGSYYRYWRDSSEEVNNLLVLQDIQRKMGWKLLNNEHTFLQRDKDSIALIGVENDGEPPFSQFADLQKAMKGTDNYFQILLSHNPTHWKREVLPESNIDIMLAGHTHAMQLELFHRSLASLKYKEWSGAYYYGNRALYVNIGAGEIGIPFRLGAWPEITIITLKHKSIN
ncbi:metallophosphoesterase [Bacteroides coprosuis]|uniref:metallophosphoesterase n=1 Tax=Bacteroides coprosuis TaxID=151276 RepID=UPI001DF62860|nr:metallophosphoesterase [Bacteroides coprosuis]HJD92733.1 metallophosphoesterase [Bacteroides coprosuis]